MKRRLLSLWGATAVLLAFGLVLVGCASVKGMYTNPAEYAVYAGDYKNALVQIDKSEAQYKKDKNTISFKLDRGLLNHYLGAYPESSTDLESVDRLIEESFTKDISDRVNAFISGDLKKIEYPGEDFESLYLNVFNALNYYHQGEIEDALVEIRRVINKMRFLTDTYKAEELTWKRAQESFKGIPSELNISNSALARYLAVLLWRSTNHPDDARIDAQEIANAFIDYPDIYNFPIPGTIVMRNGVSEELSVPKGKARLNIIAFDGLSPMKSRRVDGYFWSRLSHVFYGNPFHKGLNKTPQEKKVQVNLDTLRPILATFAHYASTEKPNWELRDLAWMLEDLSVSPEIDAQLADILAEWEIEEKKSGEERNYNDYPSLALKARKLSIQLYGDDGSQYVYDFQSESDGKKIDIFSKFWEKGMQLRTRESGVTRIEVVLDSGTSFSLDLLEDIGKIVEVLQKRREIRDQTAFVFALLSGDYKVGQQIEELGVLINTNFENKSILETAGLIGEVYVDTFKLLGSTIGFVAQRNLSLFTDIFSSKSMQDTAAARKVNKELGRFDDRMVLFLPDKAYVGGITLDPGVYSFSINYFAGEELLYSERQENVAIREDGLNLFESFYLNAR
jgi:hypothetical protein